MNRREFLGGSAAMMVGIPRIGAVATHANRRITDTVSVGFIGMGVRGQQLMKAVRQRGRGMSVLAVCDVMGSHLAAGRRLADAEVGAYSDYRYLLDDKAIDAVVIATPLHLHFPMAMDAISVGKHVYCEKTMAHDIGQTLKLWAAASHSRAVFQVGYQERSNPLFRQVKKLIDSGSCGKITYIDCQWNRNGDWRRPVLDPRLETLVNWRMYNAFSGGLMAELCSHQVDLVNWLLGSHPSGVVGMGGIDYWRDGRETFDNVTAIYRYEGGVKARFTALTTNAKEGFRMRFYGTKATLEVNRDSDQQGILFPERYPHEDALPVDGITGATESAQWLAEGIPISVDEAHGLADSTANAIREFAESITHGTLPVSNARSGAMSSIAVHMANAAMAAECAQHWKDAYDQPLP